MNTETNMKTARAITSLLRCTIQFNDHALYAVDVPPCLDIARVYVQRARRSRKLAL